MTTKLYARAYVHGINADLVAAGTVVYPSKIAMDIAATATADHMLAGVDMLGLQGGMPTKLASDIQGCLADIARDMCSKEPPSTDLAKVASAADPVELARYESYELLKLAESEAWNPKTTDAVQPNAASATGEAANAPEKKDPSTGVPAAAVTGTEHAVGQGTTPANEKVASVARALTAKIAATGAKNPKTTTAIAATAASATGEAANAPEKKDPSTGVPASAEEGVEAAQKTAAYLSRVEKIASAVIPYLPEGLHEYEHVAHLRGLSKLASFDQGRYLYMMYNAYGMPEEDSKKFATEYVKRASDMGVDEESDEDDTDDGSSDAAVAAALAPRAIRSCACIQTKPAASVATSISSSAGRMRRALRS